MSQLFCLVPESYWIFAHNGDVPSAKNAAKSGLYETKNKRYTPVGDTDSEIVFCYFLNHLLDTFPEGQSVCRSLPPSSSPRFHACAPASDSRRGCRHRKHLG